MNQRDPQSDDTKRPDPERPRAEPGKAPSTPATDMQPEDAGTPASGVGTAAEPGMKQTPKTPAETGSRR